MTTALLLSLMKDDGTAEFVALFTSWLDLDNSLHDDFVYTVAGIDKGVTFHKVNYTAP